MTDPQMPLKLNSSQRINYASTNAGEFTIQLQTSIQGTYTLKQVYIPITNFNVSSVNNVIPFFENGLAKTAILPSGYYTSTTLISAVASSMTAASGGYATYTAAQSAIPLRLTITSTQNFQLLFASQPNQNASTLLGYLPINTVSATSQLAAHSIDLSTMLHYNISVNNEIGFVTNTGQSFTFLIPLTGQTNSLTLYEPTLHFPQTVTFRFPTTSLNIKVTDDNNNVVSLGNDWSFVLSKF